jgi:hypothetical protein
VVVRRALASTLLSIGLLCGALALAAWWVQRTAFDTRNTSDIAEAALQNTEVRADLARAIADRVSVALNLDHATVQNVADAALLQPGLAGAFSGVLSDIHARLIGEATGPVTISPELVAQATGAPVAAQIPSVTVDVPTYDILDTSRRTLREGIPLLVAGAGGLIVLGLFLHPRKPVALRMIGYWLLAASVVELILAYTLPVFVVPAAIDSPYADLVAEVDKATFGPMVGVLVIMAGAGVACLVAGAWLDRPPPVARPPQTWGATPYRW